MNIRIFLYVVVLVVISTACVSCDTTPPDPNTKCVCTLIVATVHVYIVDPNYQPISDATVTVKNMRTDEYYDVENPQGPSWLYTVIDDSFKSKIRSSGDSLYFRGSKDDRDGDALFVIDVPGECRCHIRKVSGPDTLMLRGKADG